MKNAKTVSQKEYFPKTSKENKEINKANNKINSLGLQKRIFSAFSKFKFHTTQKNNTNTYINKLCINKTNGKKEGKRHF
jgi:hypothetical protein